MHMNKSMAEELARLAGDLKPQTKSRAAVVRPTDVPDVPVTFMVLVDGTPVVAFDMKRDDVDAGERGEKSWGAYARMTGRTPYQADVPGFPDLKLNFTGEVHFRA